MQIDNLDDKIKKRTKIKSFSLISKNKLGHPPSQQFSYHFLRNQEHLKQKQSSEKLSFYKNQNEKLQPVQQSNQHQSITFIKNTQKYPFSAIGLVRGTFQNFKIKQALGCLIGENLVLTSTSAILCQNYQLNQKCIEVQFIPIDLHIKKYKGYKSRRIITAEQLQNLDFNDAIQRDKSLIYDFVLIELQQNIGKYFGTLSYDFNAKIFKEWKKIANSKPLKLDLFQYKNYILIKQKKNIYNLNLKIHKYGNKYQNISQKSQYFWTYDEQIDFISEGSPLIQQKGQHYYIRGIHIRNKQYKLVLKLRQHIQKSFQKLLKGKLKVYNLEWQYINEKQCHYYFSAIKSNFNHSQQTINFIRLNLKENLLRNLGCKSLLQTKFQNIHTLILQSNRIKADGCWYLAKIKFQHLQKLDLSHNQIQDKGCSYLKNGKWPSLRKLWLNDNKINQGGCYYISETDWANNLEYLYTNRNFITTLGCKNLIKAEWHRLTHLDLTHSFIGSQGCKYLSKVQWQNLKTMFLNHNKINQGGIVHFSKSKWNNLTNLQLNFNEVGNAGVIKMKRCQWRKGTNIHLYRNKIQYQGYVFINALTETKWMIFY